MALADSKIRQVKSEEKDFWLADEKGLRLLVKNNGSKYWRMKYQFAGKQKTLALGTYPDVSLKAARLKRDDARLLLTEGSDPNAVKRSRKESLLEASANSFEVIAREWFIKEKVVWSPAHIKKQLWLLESNLFPILAASRLAISPLLLCWLLYAKLKAGVLTKQPGEQDR